MDILGTIRTKAADAATTGRPTLPPADYAPKAYADLREQYAPAYEAMQKKRDAETKVRSELKHADATYLSEAAEAARAGKTKKDPRPAIKARLEAAEVETAGAEQVCVDLSFEIYNIRQDPDAQAWWKGATDAVRAELMERAERQRSELEQTLAECAEVDRIAAWARGGKPSRAVLGVSELGKLAKLIEQHGDRRPADGGAEPRRSPAPARSGAGLQRPIRERRTRRRFSMETMTTPPGMIPGEEIHRVGMKYGIRVWKDDNGERHVAIAGVEVKREEALTLVTAYQVAARWAETRTGSTPMTSRTTTAARSTSPAATSKS